MSTQTFSKPFLFSNNKEKLKTDYFYSYWAGPWKRTGPRPQPACSVRAKGRAAAWLRVQPTAILAQHRPRRDATPTPAARHTRGRALSGHSKPREGAHKGRGGRAVQMHEKRMTGLERVACAGTSSGELAAAERRRNQPPRPLTSSTAATRGRNRRA